MIRSARKTDIERIMQIWKECDMVYNEKRSLREIAEKISNDPALLLVYEDGASSSVWGVVAGIYDPFSSYIRHLAG